MKFTIGELIRHPFHTINSHKELRYLVAGTASEAIEYFSFVLLNALFPRLLYVDNSVSFIFGVISGFLFHKTWTFRGEQQFKTHQQAVGYVSLAGVNFIAINAFIALYVHAVHITPDLAKLAAIASTVVWTYLISNYIIFRHKKPV